jgi:sugar/nucleoside kinase (ribokinase family)
MRALVLGGASWNTMIYLDALPDGTVGTIPNARKYETVGSTGTGKAFALAAMGVDTVLHAALGQDPEGELIRVECSKLGVALISDVDPMGTPQHVNLMDKTGNRLSIFVNSGSGDIDVDLERFARELDRADVVFLNIVPSSLPLLPLLATCPAPVWVDLHDWDGKNPWHEAFIEHAHVVQLSDEALGDNQADIIRDLFGRGIKMVVLTKGSKGAEILTSDGTQMTVAAHPVDQIVDSNGAGDTFMASLWAALQGGKSLQQAAELAAYHAAQTVQHSDLAPERFK